MFKITNLVRKLKGFFYLLRADLFIPSKMMKFTAYAADLSKWIAQNTQHGFHDFYSYQFNYVKRFELYEHVITTFDLDAQGIDYLEFGVSKGESFRWWTNRMKHKDHQFYGFDTFSGLPEKWGKFKKGAMGNDGQFPEIDDDRYVFYQGLFQKTLIPFLNDYQPGKRKVIHMDADLYTATLYVLTLLTPILKPGDVIFFDEFNVPMHEYKAFREWTDSFYIKYEVLGSVNNFYQMAMMIK